MKTITTLKVKAFVSLSFLFVTIYLHSQVTIGNYDFDGGNNQGWIDGGTYASMLNNATWGCNNTGNFFIRYDYDIDNSSSFTSPAFDATPYTDLEFDFCLQTTGVNNNDGFDLELYDGTNWVTVRQYRKGVDFTGNGSGVSTNFTETLNSGTYNFDSNSQFRFIGQAVNTNDFILIDDVVIRGLGAPPAYCTSTGNLSFNTGITNVTIGSINNSDGIGKDVGYEDFTALSTTVEQGGTETISLRVNTGGTGTVYAMVFIDWNQDFDFDDANESYNLGTATTIDDGATSASPFTINIPVGATLGTTRMRVAAQYNSAPIACEPTAFDGEVEDYSIEVIVPTPEPEIDIVDSGNNPISDGSIDSPATGNSTDFGLVQAGASSVETYTIENNGVLDLVISSWASSNTDFVVSAPALTTIPAGSSTTFTVTFNPTSGGVSNSTITINNNDSAPENVYTFTVEGEGVACNTTVASFPYNEGFETGLGDWTQDTSDDRDWTRTNVRTPSDLTGPNLAYEGSWYMFTEGSTPNFNSEFNLVSPCFDLTSAPMADFSFYYHMHGNSMGTLDVEVSTDNGLTYSAPVWTQTGEVQTSEFDPWIRADVDLSAYLGQTIRIRFNGTTGIDFTSDMAIDNISLLTAPTPEIDILSNSVTIADGDTTPSTTDNTDFGLIAVGLSSVETYTIENNGTADLTISSWSSSNADFTVSTPGLTTIPVGSSTTFTVTFNPSSAGAINSTITINNNDIAPEDIYTFTVEGEGFTCGTSITSFPYNEGFETGLGNWTQDTGDDRNWTRTNVRTPSDFTGPDSAHEGSWYMFTEGSNPNFNSVFNLVSPCFDLTSELAADFSFYYHMYGGDMGTLDVEVSTDNGLTYSAPVWTQSGEVQTGESDAWIQANIDLSAYLGQIIRIRFNGTTGFDYESDMAIDDISLTTSPSPEINIQGNSITIADGDTTPSTTDNTDFGSTDNLSPVTQTYTIQNLGALDLVLSSWSSSNSDFVISTPPALTTISSGSSTTFSVTFTPSGSGITSSIITINNNDNTPEDVYTFTVQGEGLLPDPQYTAYFHTFDNSDEGWTSVTSTGDSWVRTDTFTTTDEMGDGNFFRNNSYNTYNSNTNIVIESPVFDFSDLSNLKLSLDVKYNTENSVDGLRILYSVAGGAYTVLGNSGDGVNWYDGNASALGGDGWYGDGHPTDPTFTGAHNQFVNASINLSSSTFAGQNNVRFRIQFASDASNNFEGVAFDNFKIIADPSTIPASASVAPANLTSNLRLWLKANSGISNTDNTPLTLWEDQAYGTDLDKEDAISSTTLAPTYRDSGARNINFNPVADFDNSAATRQYMNGKGGLFSEDLFVVFRSDDTIENDTGAFTPGRQFAIGGRFAETDYHEDATGIAVGSSTARYENEIVAFNVSSFPNGATSGPNDTSYGRAYTSITDTFSNHPLIINVKTNTGNTATEIYKNGKRVDNTTGQAGNGTDLNFNELENLPYLLGTGRSGISGRTVSQMNGMIAEVISYSSANSAINKQKIQTYLALKYGVTLQADNSTLLDHRLNDTNYIDSGDTVIWDTSATDINGNSYNYDVAGIGRDDASHLDQRQSRSQNDEADLEGPTSGFLTMGLTDIYETNNQNISSTSPLADRNFLMWGNNNADLEAAPMTVDVDMSENIPGLTTDVSFVGMQRIWRVVETGDVGRVKVSIPENTVRNINPPGDFLMFISDNGEFTPTAEYRVMSSDGSGNLDVEYDFTGVKYITFGYAPEIIVERSINFVSASQNYIDVEDNLDLNTAFTLSTWIKREPGSANTSIVSKRNVGYSEGYDLKIMSDGRVEMNWINGSTRSIQSSVVIPENVWHHIAVTHDGTTARLYIDGVLETTETLPLPLNTNRSFLIGAAGRDGSAESYFDGNIDEVRVWNTALTDVQIQFLMNQELEDNAGTIGKYFDNNGILPTKNDAIALDFSNLRAYFPMSRYTYTNTNDESGNDLIGYLRQLRTVDFQTAPLPYISNQDGDWEDNSTWRNGNVQTIPGARSLADNEVSVDWNIVQTGHDITIDNTALFDDDLIGLDDLDGNDNEGNRTVLAHVLDAGEVTVNGDNVAKTGYGYTVTHYFELNGKLDLEGESQFIQTVDSDLIVGTNGELEKDQQGTTNTFHYNYWSAPVGVTSIAPTDPNNVNRYEYTVSNIMRDGASAVNFSASGFNGSATTPITIADYWIWKFANNPDGDYSAWEHIRRNGNILPGEGFTMKGPGTTGTEQNYTFLGKPNNADINLTISANNDYLVGNPYASAIDADQFIIDNGPTLYYNDAVTPEADATTSGTLYFWEHWGGSSHILSEYQGGYATYNLAGGVTSSYSLLGTNDPDVGSGGTPTKTPERYIPVGQGFFVVAANGGTINFNNDQRVFKKEAVGQSTFVRSSSNNANASNPHDTRQKIKIGFNSVGNRHRQLLLTIDDRSTPGIDWAFDGDSYDFMDDDMFWLVDNHFLVIQGSNEMNDTTSYPLVVYTSRAGENTFMIDELMNIPDDQEIYLHDKDLGVYHDIKESNYSIFLNAGYFDSRFEIVFSNPNALSNDDFIQTDKNLDIVYANSIDKLVLINPHGIAVDFIEIYSLLGQRIVKLTDIDYGNNTEYNIGDLSSGAYIIKLNTESGSVSKKVLID